MIISTKTKFFLFWATDR